MMSRYSRLAFYIAVILAALALQSPASQPSAILKVEPAQEVYYAGQDVRLLIELEIPDGELSERLSLEGIPHPPQARVSDFREMESEKFTRANSLITRRRFRSDMRLLAEGLLTVEMSISGKTVEKQRRGFMTFYDERPFRAGMEAVRLRVSPLPQAPGDFSGCVGEFTLTGAVDSLEASPGDLVNLSWTLRGRGNTEMEAIPSVAETEHLRVYPPRVEKHIPGRELTVSQVVVPQTLDAGGVPALSFSIFNPREGVFKRLTAGPYELRLAERRETAPTERSEWVPKLTGAERGAVAGLGPEAPTGRRAAPVMVFVLGLAGAVFVFSALLKRSRVAAVVLSCVFVVAAYGGKRFFGRGKGDAEAVIIADTSAYLCPGFGSRVLGAVPRGAVVRVNERVDSWVRVEYGGASVWVPGEAVGVD